jgi:hypothetical protein
MQNQPFQTGDNIIAPGYNAIDMKGCRPQRKTTFLTRDIMLHSNTDIFPAALFNAPVNIGASVASNVLNRSLG